MSAFDDAFESVLKLHGGYANPGADKGGASVYGLDEYMVRKTGYTGPLKDFPLAKAKEAYQSHYWAPLNLDGVAEVSQPVALKLFDIALNRGRGRTAKSLQRTLNELNRQQADYPDVTVDGTVNPETIAALTAFMDKQKPQGETVLLDALASAQVA
ncbi:hypothetical protein OG215_37715 (plasmid) [Streptomyces globisporus]|uniref:glycosyl hydrolase 108 family protein n=1 Tax=Streptomyces globisporus TaxID=1908 RepID=UPI002F91A7BA|nr:hypothetical protein OG215_37715 [Streptomyces globisporus]